MSAAWEWRGFRAPDRRAGLQEITASLGDKLGLRLVSEGMAETDTYLLIRGMRHNLKLRRGALELKRESARIRHGYSLWQDKEVWPFPVGSEQLSCLWGFLPDRPDCPPGTLSSPFDLIEALRQTAPALAVVPVQKHRSRLEAEGGARLEVAELELPGAGQWLSFCIDGYELEAVRTLVRRSGLRRGTREWSYVEFLQEAVWRCTATSGEAVTRDGR